VSGRIGHYLRIEQRIREEIDQVEIRFIPLTVDDTIVEFLPVSLPPRA
jgi:hypothetical protein